MKAAAFGDSFLVPGSQGHHWLEKLRDNQNWDILGMDQDGNMIGRTEGGSGPLSAISIFYNTIHELDDIDTLIFSWSQPSRLFHNKVRDINMYNALKDNSRGYPEHKKIYETALDYYSTFYLDTMEDLKLVGLLQWFDKVLCKDFSNKKILHFYSFGAGTHPHTGDNAQLANQYLFHKFQSGVTMYPSLMYFSVNEPTFVAKKQHLDQRSGHLGESNHDMIYNKVLEAMKMNPDDECLLTESRPKYITDKYVDIWKDIDINHATPPLFAYNKQD